MGIINRIQHSFSAKLSFYILLFTGTVFTLCFFFFYLFTSRTISSAANEQAGLSLHTIECEIEKVFGSIETAHANLLWTFIDKGMPPDSMYNFTREIVRNNPDIFGSAIAFEPYYFESRGYWFSPYSSARNKDSIRTIQLGTPDYDYFGMEWFTAPRRTGKPGWSAAYYDDGGGDMLMSTYSTPLFNNQDEFIGVVTADVSLDWLEDFVDSIKPYPDSYCIIIGHDSCFVIHPEKALITKNAFAVADSLDDARLARIAYEMIAKEKGTVALRDSHDSGATESYLFFKDLNAYGWSLGLIINKNDIFGGLYRTRTYTILLFGAGLVLLFVFCMLIIRRITRPLHKFSASAREIAQGNFHVVLPVIHSKDEMKELHDSFSFMQKELADYIIELKKTTAQKERIESELRIASDIQAGMIPKIFPPFPHRKDVDLYALLKPAREVGGDLYDFFIQDERLYFIIGDVSGKGVPASLFMAVTRSLFRTVGMLYEEPDQIISSMNKSVAETNESNMFVTLFIGILDLESGLLKYVNAGHNPPILIHPGGEIAFIQVNPNIPVGVFDEMCFKTDKLTIPAGAILFLYTDGLTEAENIREELYSETRIIPVLQNITVPNARTVISTITDSVMAYSEGAEQSDDLTLFAIQYKGKL